MLGFPDQSRVQDRQCIEIVKGTNDQFLVASAQIYGAEVTYYCGEVDQVDQRSTEAQSLLGITRSVHPQLIGWCGMLADFVSNLQRDNPAEQAIAG
jgi:hypothetical protein